MSPAQALLPFGGTRYAVVDQAVAVVDVSRLARRIDPPTSKAAARSSRRFVPNHEANILRWLAGNGPGTKDTIAAGTGLESVAVARRMRKMADAGLVRELGTCRLGSGRAAIRWAAVESPRLDPATGGD